MAGYVVFTFDDSIDYRMYDGAWPLLAGRGMNGTVYQIGDLIDADSPDPGGLARAQAMYAAGWDIGNHTWHHVDLTAGASQALAQTQLRTQAEWLCANGMPRAAYHFAYPVSHTNALARAACAAEGILSARMGDSGAAFVDASVDEYALPTFGLDYNSYTVAQAKAVVDQVEAAAAGAEKTVVFEGHGVPSFEGTGFTLAMYEELADYIRDIVYRSADVQVVTISEWYELHKAPTRATTTRLTYGGRTLNDKATFSLRHDFDPGENVKTFDEYRGYDGITVAQTNVSEASLVDMTVPLIIQSASAAGLRAAVAAINRKIDAGAQELVYDDGSGPIVYSCVESSRLGYVRTETARIGGLFADLSLRRTPTSLRANGGTITTDGPCTVHTFTSSGTFEVPAGNTLDAEILVVGGGGGGSAGGGGGGGYLGERTSPYIYPAALSGRIPVIVGLGGVAGTTGSPKGSNGGDSMFGAPEPNFGYHARGGGGGGANTDGLRGGADGGSGGGGGSGTGSVGGAAVPGGLQGHAGGTYGGFAGSNPAGGGGGFSEAGHDAPDTLHGGAGGFGWDNDISGVSRQYCGGGGGCIKDASAGGGAGSCGGGDGSGSAANGQAGTDGTGGGGGGAGAGRLGGKGGKGIVVVRYPTP